MKTLSAARLAPLIAAAIAPGGVVVSDQPLGFGAGWTAPPLPPEIAPGRYFIYRAPLTPAAAPAIGSADGRAGIGAPLDGMLLEDGEPKLEAEALRR